MPEYISPLNETSELTSGATGPNFDLRQNRSSENEIYFWEAIILDPSVYTMDHSDLPVMHIISNFME